MVDIVLYDLAGKDRSVRFSPFCWLVKFALLHKGLEFSTVPLGFLPKSDYPDPDHGKLPVVRHGDQWLKESVDIITFLDREYPERPLVGDETARDRLEKYRAWLGSDLFPNLGPQVFFRVPNAISDEDAAYFRETREERFGVSVEELAKKPGLQENLAAAFQIVEADLADTPFLGGSEPDLSDYTVMSPLMWKRSITSEAVFTLPPKMAAWHDRMLDLYDGYGRNTACAEC